MANATKGLIRSRPKGQKNLGSTTTGLREMGLETDRDGFLYVPESFNPKSQSPLLIFFHGAGGTAQQSVDTMKSLADDTGTILVAPQSQGQTWDLMNGGFGADIELVDEALSDVFALYPIDSNKIAVGGLSDGATYALSVGLTNDDLVTHVIAFSPNVAVPEPAKAKPQIFTSHEAEKSVPKDLGKRAFSWFLGHN